METLTWRYGEGGHGTWRHSVRYAARTGQNGHEHSVSARLDAVFIEL